MALRRALCKAGLHARPAAVFVRAVLDSGQDTRIGRPSAGTVDDSGTVDARSTVDDSGTVDARSIVSVLALDIQPGETVILTGGDEALLDRLAAMLEADQ